MSAPSAPPVPPAPSEADVIAADLPAITLADRSPIQSPVTLEAGMANMRLVERRYGSIAGLIAEFNLLVAQDGETKEDVAKRPVFGAVIDVLACFMPRGPLRDPDELAEHLVAARVGEYVTALENVIRLAFPQAPAQTDTQTPVAGPGNGLASPAPQTQFGTIPPFPGPLSGTAPPSSSAAPTPSSGG